MVTEFLPRHGPDMHRMHAGLPGRKTGAQTMNAIHKVFEALPALLLAAALMMPALAVLG